MSAREHATRTCGALIKPVRRNWGKGSGSLAGYEQSPRSAYTEVFDNGLEASTRINYQTVVDRFERDGGELAPVYCWGRVSGLNPSEGRFGHLSQYSTCRLVRAEYCTQ